MAHLLGNGATRQMHWKLGASWALIYFGSGRTYDASEPGSRTAYGRRKSGIDPPQEMFHMPSASAVNL